MTFKIRVDGGKRLAKKLRRIPVDSRQGMRRAIATSAVEIQGAAQRLIEQGPTRTGVVRRVTKAGKLHQASAPGEPPKTLSGGLVRSIFAEMSKNGLAADVGTDLKYGEYLEFGTTRMAARPWLQVTFGRLRPKIRERIRKAFLAELKRATR